MKRAHKPHRCAWCGRTIQINEPMVLISTTHYGLAVTHPACRALWIRNKQAKR